MANKINSYYGRSYFSLPSSFVTYKLAFALNKLDNEYLWYAIVGTTTMYLEQKLSKEVLETVNENYRHAMIKLNPPSESRDKGNIYSRKDFQFTLLRYWSLYDSIQNSPYMLTKFKLW